MQVHRTDQIKTLKIVADQIKHPFAPDNTIIKGDEVSIRMVYL